MDIEGKLRLLLIAATLGLIGAKNVITGMVDEDAREKREKHGTEAIEGLEDIYEAIITFLEEND